MVSKDLPEEGNLKNEHHLCLRYSECQCENAKAGRGSQNLEPLEGGHDSSELGRGK